MVAKNKNLNPLKKPQIGARYHIVALSEDTDKEIGTCIIEVVGNKTYKVIETTGPMTLQKPFKSRSVKDAGRFVLRRYINKYKENRMDNGITILVS